MKKRVLSIMLILSMMIGILVPLQVVADSGNTATPVVDTSWYDSSAASGTVFEIADAADLRGAARLSQQGVTFSGYTLKLTNNIDLNPGWNAKVTVSGGKATLPDAPTVEFLGFATFAGTLDGNGKTLSGVYMAQRLTAGSANLGFIEILNGTVKNLVFNNSLIFADIADGVNDCKIGGIAARMNSTASLIDTVYADIDVWYRGWSWQRVAGIVGKTGAACALKNIAFVGTVGTMTPGDAVPTTTTDGGMSISQLVGDGDWKSGLVLTDCALNGTEYAPTVATTGKAVGNNDSAQKTNVGTNLAVPTAVAAMNPTAYTNSLAAFNLWPTISANATYDEGKQAYVKYYRSATQSNYNDYLETLESKGYNPDATYTVGNNSYALYQKAGAYSVFVSLFGESSSKRMRVFVEPFGTAYNVNAEATTATVCDSKIWQLDVDNDYSDSDGGMSYVIRLTDGTFIVIDGGFASEAEAKNLYTILNYNNPNGGKPVIRAWFITHLHNDHFGGLTKFSTTYASNVTVEGFYYNFPGSNVSGEENADPVTVDSIKTVEMAMNMFDGAVRYRKIHSGMTFGFAGVTATVLGTHEDVKQSISLFESNDFKDGNDTSTVIKFTVGSQSFMVLGDARMGMSDQLTASYSDSVLKSDIVQMSHHGFTGARDELYQAIDASVVLWPMDVVTHNPDSDANYNPFKDYYNRTGISANEYVKNNADEVIPAYENVCLTMPYTAKTYSGGQKVVDVDQAQKDKFYNLAVDTSKADTTWYDANVNTYYLYDAGDVLGFANLAAGGNTFAGKTIMLMANIDLNPGWNADVTIGDTVVFPTTPSVTWPNIATFSGTLDGNGYTLRGIYKSMTAAGGAGVHGGMFNTFAGTMKNIKIENSFILTTNSDWGHKNVHVGGIAGNVNAGATLSGVYLDAEVWYKSHENCMLGGAFGFANGKYNVSGFVFAGRAGNTNLQNETNYSTPSGKDIYIAALIGCQNWKENNTNLADVILTGELYSGRNSKQNPLLGADFSNWSMTRFVGGKLTAADLASDGRANLRTAGWKYVDAAGSAIPANVVALVDGTYSHLVDYAKDMEVPELLYQVSDVVDGKYDIRFVSGINKLDLANQIGFDIELIVGGNSYKLDYSYTLTDTVYESVIGAGETIYAEDWGYEYFYARAITGISATDTVLIKISSLAVDIDGNTIVGAPMTFSFVYGTGNVVSR